MAYSTLTMKYEIFHKLTLFLLIATGIRHVRADGIDFTDCGSLFTIDNLELDHCDDSNCNMYIGRDSTISFTFNTGSLDQSATLVKEAFLLVRGAKFNLTVTPEDPCEVVTCPVSKNFTSNYTATVAVDPDFLPINALFYWVMRTNYSVQVVCLNFPVYVVNYDDVD